MEHPIFKKYITEYPESKEAEFNNFAHRLWEGRIPEALEVADPIERMNLARILFPEVVEYKGKIIIKDFTKTIYNPVTGKFYQVANRSQINAEAGQIRGLWHNDRNKKKCRHGRHGHRDHHEIKTDDCQKASDLDEVILRKILFQRDPDELIAIIQMLPQEKREMILKAIPLGFEDKNHVCTCGSKR